jgi:cytochrome c-type biogenesis protein CcmH
MTGLLIFLSLLPPTVSGAYAPQQAGSSPLEPALEARVQKLGKELRCAVCQGLSIADSPASMARAQLDKVRELVSAGKSDDEVRAYFVARYGEWVLLSPKASGINWLVWLGPALLLVFGFIVIARQIRRSPAKRPASSDTAGPAVRDAAPPEPAAASDDDYLRQVRSELQR